MDSGILSIILAVGFIVGIVIIMYGITRKKK